MLELLEFFHVFFVENGYVFEMTVAAALFGFCFEKKRLFWLRFALAFAALMAVSVVWNLPFVPDFFVFNWLKYATLYCMVGLGLWLCLRTSSWGVLFCTIGAVCTQHISFRLAAMILSLMHRDFNSFEAGFIVIGCMAVVYIAIYFVFVRRFRDAPEKYFENRFNILLGMAIAAITIFLHMMLEEVVSMADTFIYSIISVYNILFCIFTLCLQYGAFRSKKLADSRDVLELLMHKQAEQYRTGKENIELINVKCHDMKYRLSRLDGRIDEKELKEIKNAIDIYDMSVKTGNEVLDTFLTEKIWQCEQSDVKFDCIADGACLSFLSPPDLYSLFGNAIDNAFEAVRRIEDPEKRIISLTVRRKLNMVTVHVENYFAGELDFEGGLPLSTKGDARYHGFGLRSIRMVAEKYKGNVTVFAKDGVFNLNIIIPQPSAE